MDLLEAIGWDFVVAEAKLAALLLLPGRHELASWAAEARATFEDVGARPYLRLLDELHPRARAETVGVAS